MLLKYNIAWKDIKVVHHETSILMTWLGIENVENEVENYAKHVNIDCFRLQYIDNKCKKTTNA